MTPDPSLPGGGSADPAGPAGDGSVNAVPHGAAAATVAPAIRGPRPRWRRTLRRALRNPNLMFGAAVLLLYLVLALLGPALAPYGVDDQDLFSSLIGPTREHLLGTDSIGRDLLSRVIVGTRYSLSIAVLSVLFGSLLGIPVGLLAGFFGGRTDSLLMGFIDILLTIPVIVLAIAIVTVMGPGMVGLVTAIAISFAPRLARLTRGRVFEVKEEVFVSAATALGGSVIRILGRHVLPNAFAPLIIEITLRAGQAVLVGAALGFLGLGVQPPTPEWGTMLSRGREYLEIAPHVVVAPGLAISLLVLGFNLFGDGLRDAWDPSR